VRLEATDTDFFLLDFVPPKTIETNFSLLGFFLTSTSSDKI
jgi:hypothetical protein